MNFRSKRTCVRPIRPPSLRDITNKIHQVEELPVMDEDPSKMATESESFMKEKEKITSLSVVMSGPSRNLRSKKKNMSESEDMSSTKTSSVPAVKEELSAIIRSRKKKTSKKEVLSSAQTSESEELELSSAKTSSVPVVNEGPSRNLRPRKEKTPQSENGLKNDKKANRKETLKKKSRTANSDSKSVSSIVKGEGKRPSPFSPVLEEERSDRGQQTPENIENTADKVPSSEPDVERDPAQSGKQQKRKWMNFENKMAAFDCHAGDTPPAKKKKELDVYEFPGSPTKRGTKKRKGVNKNRNVTKVKTLWDMPIKPHQPAKVKDHEATKPGKSHRTHPVTNSLPSASLTSLKTPAIAGNRMRFNLGQGSETTSAASPMDTNLSQNKVLHSSDSAASKLNTLQQNLSSSQSNSNRQMSKGDKNFSSSGNLEGKSQTDNLTYDLILKNRRLSSSSPNVSAPLNDTLNESVFKDNVVTSRSFTNNFQDKSNSTANISGPSPNCVAASESTSRPFRVLQQNSSIYDLNLKHRRRGFYDSSSSFSNMCGPLNDTLNESVFKEYVEPPRSFPIRNTGMLQDKSRTSNCVVAAASPTTADFSYSCGIEYTSTPTDPKRKPTETSAKNPRDKALSRNIKKPLIDKFDVRHKNRTALPDLESPGLENCFGFTESPKGYRIIPEVHLHRKQATSFKNKENISFAKVQEILRKDVSPNLKDEDYALFDSPSEEKEKQELFCSDKNNANATSLFSSPLDEDQGSLSFMKPNRRSYGRPKILKQKVEEDSEEEELRPVSKEVVGIKSYEKKKQDPKVDKWALELSSHFNDIEEVELNVE